MNDKILDHNIFNEIIIDSVDWWEHKRKLYNIVIVSVSILATISLSSTTIDQIFYDIVEVIIWIFGANIFYCLGLGCDLALSYYRGKNSETVRKVFFVSGLFFSIIWSMLGISQNSFY